MPFRDLDGHSRLLDLTARAAMRGSLPPSLIFAGPEGVGKRRAAIALAQLFNCASPAGLEANAGPDACGHCSPCRRIGRGVHADVLIIEPGGTGSIKVDQARQIIERSAYRPYEGRRRLVILDDADGMEVSAQNALLKTLEEPPDASTFVLVTARPEMLLPTVQSRCQRLRFGPLSPGEVAAVLMRDHGFAGTDAQAAALLAGGSIRRALDADTTGYVQARKKALATLTAVAASSNPRERLAAAKLLGGDNVDRQALGSRLRLLSSMLRDLGILLSRADEQALANADMKASLERLLTSFDGERTVRAFSAVDRALSALDQNASPKIVADWLAFQI